MGLFPLEFTDCLQDSPYFRDSLHSHEKELERTSNNIKELVKEVKNLLQAAKHLSNAQRRLSQRLTDFKFECIGNNQTEDEMVIANSLREFGKLIAAIEDEKDRLLDRAYEQFIIPLENFRKEHIGAVKERKKKFEKQTAKFCASQEKYLGLSTKKQDTLLQEADASLELERRDFIRAGLEYVCLIQEVQERKKFEFVETLLGFMYSWLTFYHSSHEVAKDHKPHMTELQSRIQTTRDHFNASREDIRSLMSKMLEVRQSKTVDPGILNKMFTRSGYLFLMEKKALGTTWNKFYCHYQREGRLFCMIPYNQATGKMMSTQSTESFRLKTCMRRISDSIDKRFCFDITPEDKSSSVYTFQALSEEDRSLWMDAMDGKEPMYVHAPKPSNAHQTFLDQSGFEFVTRCFQTLENRGLDDQGLYRVVGVASKVTKLLSAGLDKKRSEKINFDEPLEWETKTITSAAKTYLRNLPEPLMTFKMHTSFIAAAKLDAYEQRVAEVARLVDQLPEPHKRMLEILCCHLEKVAAKSYKNMMTVGNLGVCFGPTLLRDEEETVAAIMDIKFANVVVEILVENWRQILLGEPPARDFSRRISTDASQPKLIVLPLSPNQPTTSTPPKSFSGSPPSRLVSPPQRAPPPYPHPPPPPAPVIYNNGPPKMMTHRSPPSHPPPPPPPGMSPAAASAAAAAIAAAATSGTGPGTPGGGNSSYHSATWERTLRMNSSSSLVPPPLGSAPPAGSSASATTSPQHHKPVRASLSSLSSSHIEQQVNPASGGGGAASMMASSGSMSGVTTASSDEWYRSNKVSTAKTLQLHRQLSAGSGSFPGTGGSSTPNRSSEDFYREDPFINKRYQTHQATPSLGSGQAASATVAPPVAAPRSFKQLPSSSSSASTESLTSSSSHDLNAQKEFEGSGSGSGPPGGIGVGPGGNGSASNLLSEAAAASAASQAMVAAATAKFGLDSNKHGTSSSSSSTTSSRMRDPSGGEESQRKVRTLYACVGEHESELNFEPNQVITDVRPSLEPGWLEGCLDGKRGLVPENYVEFLN